MRKNSMKKSAVALTLCAALLTACGSTAVSESQVTSVSAESSAARRRKFRPTRLPPATARI